MDNQFDCMRLATNLSLTLFRSQSDQFFVVIYLTFVSMYQSTEFTNMIHEAAEIQRYCKEFSKIIARKLFSMQLLLAAMSERHHLHSQNPGTNSKNDSPYVAHMKALNPCEGEVCLFDKEISTQHRIIKPKKYRVAMTLRSRFISRQLQHKSHLDRTAARLSVPTFFTVAI